MNVRVLYNYILTILGIREMLPSDIINSKPVRECGEPMIRLNESKGLFPGDNATFCRRSVAEKLKVAAEGLSEMGLGLYIYELYRSPEEQQARFDRTYRLLQEKYTNKDELERYARRSTAGVGGGHQTGGAVDLTLCDGNGTPLDMGSKYLDKCPQMVTSYRLPEEFVQRRKLLCKVLREVGFANYPGEWWHFSYGDRLWAAYRYKRFAIYGLKSNPYTGCE